MTTPTRLSLSYIAGVTAESGLVGTALRIVASTGGGTIRSRILSSPGFYRLASRRARAALAKNERYRNRHKGERAFVVATGPSVAKQSLDALQSGIVISVNENFEYLRDRGVVPHYNVLQDDAYFRSAKSYSAFRSSLVKAATTDSIIPVLPLRSANRFADERGWDSIDPVYFLEVGDALLAGSNIELTDFMQPLPGLATVTHVAVAWALFLGCRRIDVLGVDLDYAAAPGRPIRHCYGTNPYSDVGTISASEAFRKYSRVLIKELGEHVRRQSLLFDQLGAVAAARGQTVVDASLHGKVGSLEKQPLSPL